MKTNLINIPLFTPLMAGDGTASLEYSYASQESIPEGFDSLYTERDGVYHLTGVRGLKTPADISALQEGNRKEREDHKITKQALSKYSQLGEYDDVVSKLDRFTELELSAGGKLDDEAINKIVEARIGTRINPLQRQLDDINREKQELLAENKALKEKDRKRVVTDDLRKACVESKVLETAVDDVLLIGGLMFEVAEDGSVITTEMAGQPGLPAKVWLTDQQKVRPHWWPETNGSGARGGNGRGGVVNPWSKEHWNMTEQGKMVQANRVEAEKMATQAGSFIGATKATS